MSAQAGKVIADMVLVESVSRLLQRTGDDQHVLCAKPEYLSQIGKLLTGTTVVARCRIEG